MEALESKWTCEQTSNIDKAIEALKDALAQHGEHVAWKHSCNALCVDELELFIDSCPHCGKPRSAGAAPAPHPGTREVVEQLLYCINCWRDAYAITATSKEASAIQAGQKLLESLK